MKPVQKFLQLFPKSVRKYLLNKYLLAIGIFLLVLLFFDQYSLKTQWKLRKTEQRLQQDKDYYQQEIERAWKEKRDLEENTEKYAREKYKMSRKDEDVFIFEDEK
ncbi:MAG TPA: hypothetical protein ENJ88_10775 [Phaeodactylibacter sp.]|nr:hypothetical protein [Phaeodactylibacter sp.]